MNKNRYDVVIIGGAIMGSSAAFWLNRLAGQGLSVLVVEPDPSYARSSTALSVASIRQQFSIALNVRISQFGLEFIRNISAFTGDAGGVQELGFRENGYLFLAGHDSPLEAMYAANAVQQSAGADTSLLTPQELARRFTWMNTDDVALASFGARNEGWFDNMGLLGAMRSAARVGGVRYLNDRVVGVNLSGATVTGVTLASGEIIGCGCLINAAGTRAAEIMRMADQVTPVEPRKRTVFLIDAPNIHAPEAPLLVDHGGFYLRPEGQQWICATVPQSDAAVDPEDFEPDHHLFEAEIWEKLYARASGFDAVKVLRNWVGHYAFNTLDQNAIVGLWPGLTNLYVMNGFSGHGLQQAPAMGRGIAELIISGAYQSLDLSEFGAERIFANQPIREKAVV